MTALGQVQTQQMPKPALENSGKGFAASFLMGGTEAESYIRALLVVVGQQLVIVVQLQ